MDTNPEQSDCGCQTGQKTHSWKIILFVAVLLLAGGVLAHSYITQSDENTDGVSACTAPEEKDCPYKDSDKKEAVSACTAPEKVDCPYKNSDKQEAVSEESGGCDGEKKEAIVALTIDNTASCDKEDDTVAVDGDKDKGGCDKEKLAQVQ